MLVKKEKICGILQEITYINNKTFLVIGAGINTNNAPIIKNYKATSLKTILNKPINNDKLLKDIQNSYEKFILQTKKYKFIELKKKILKNR